VTLLVISPDYASHAVPLISLAGVWRDAGQRVVVATGPAVAPLVAGAGMEFASLALGRGSNPGVARPEQQPAGEDDNLRAFFDATRRGMVPTLRYQAEARERDLLWEPVETARRTIEVVGKVRPDAVLVDHLAFGATIGLRAIEAPYADVVLGHPRQLPVLGEIYGVPSAWPSAISPGAEELSDLLSIARRVADRFTGVYNDALRAVSAETTLVEDAFAAHGSLVLLNYPQALHDRQRTAGLPRAHAFLGATPHREQPSAAVEAWLGRDADRPLVLVSLGTFLSARDDVLRIIAQGLRQLDVRVALATGSTDPRSLGPMPSGWLVDAYLPQVSILERASAMVTHAGNNSFTEALAHGVPMLALPFSPDQFDGAAAIEAAGLGLAADPNRVTPSEVAAAVRSILGTAHPALDQLSAELASRPGAGIARAAVGEWLDGVATVEI
jgi:MGT family glycosyltransferase